VSIWTLVSATEHHVEAGAGATGPNLSVRLDFGLAVRINLPAREEHAAAADRTDRAGNRVLASIRTPPAQAPPPTDSNKPNTRGGQNSTVERGPLFNRVDTLVRFRQVPALAPGDPGDAALAHQPSHPAPPT